MSTFGLTVQATIAMVLLVDPFIRLIFFRMLTENEPERRREYVGETSSAGPEEIPRTGGTEAGQCRRHPGASTSRGSRSPG